MDVLCFKSCMVKRRRHFNLTVDPLISQNSNPRTGIRKLRDHVVRWIEQQLLTHACIAGGDRAVLFVSAFRVVAQSL